MTDLSDDIVRGYADGRYSTAPIGTQNREDIVAMARELLQRREADRWQPISQYRPINTAKDGLCDDPILGWWRGADCDVVYWRDGGWRSSMDDPDNAWTPPDYWRPLPPPPEDAP